MWHAGEAMISLDHYLELAGRQFDPEVHMIGRPWRSPGYHTALEDGRFVHLTRETVYYALALLERDSSTDQATAEGAIDAVLALQDTDPVRASFGSWPWTAEEPIDAMPLVDMNWADFIGVGLSLLLLKHRGKVSGGLASRVESALFYALQADFRRNMRPSYTNIAVMGASLCLVGGRALENEFFRQYGRRRLERFAEYTDEQRGFNEYNSPTYSVVAALELERILRFSDDDAASAVAERILTNIWRMIVAHLHPQTGEWGGPHARAYTERLMPSARFWLAERLPRDLGDAFRGEEVSDLRDGSILDRAPVFHDPVPCPESVVSELRGRIASDGAGTTDRHVHIRFADSPPMEATVYRDNRLIFGTMSEECFWTQRHGIIGYLASEESEVGVLRVRGTKDGNDFASLGFRATQWGRVALVGAVSFSNLGDWHLMLDRPGDSTFSGRSLALEVQAPAQWRALPDGRFAAEFDGARIVLVPGPAESAHTVRTWQASGNTLSLPLYHSGGRSLRLTSLVPMVAVFGLAVVSNRSNDTDGVAGEHEPRGLDSSPTVDDWETGATPTPTAVEAQWAALPGKRLQLPTSPVSYRFPG